MNGRKNHNNPNGDHQHINSPDINNNQYPIIGIDLGISYWSVAVVKNGKVHVIPFFGQKNIPAFVACLKDGFRFGDDAKQMFFDNREVTIFDMLYILGLRFNSGSELEQHMNDYSYSVSNIGDKPKLCFANKKPDISIEELFDIIINNLTYTCEIFLNETVHNIVVPIPVYFKESQKSALLKATTQVGIVELLPEPIAAAYAYRIHEKYENDPKDRYFLIYNLQEDNIDVSVVQYAKNKFNIKSNLYERHLKRNYTFRFLDELCTQTYETYFISNPRFHPLNSGTLRYYCKRIFEDILHSECFDIEMDTVKEEKIVRSISRAELDELLRILVLESMLFVKSVLHEAKLEARDIDEVLLVGQVTRHAIVRHYLKYLFGKNSLNCSLSPEDVLVIGAALRADILQREIYGNSTRSPNHVISSGDPPIPTDLEKLKYLERNEKYMKKCFEAGDIDRKLLIKQKFKQKPRKRDAIKKRKTKIRDKMLSMCTLFSNVVSGSDLKMPVKEKLLFVSSYLCNELRSRSKSFKKSSKICDLKEDAKNIFAKPRKEHENFLGTNKQKIEELEEELNLHGTNANIQLKSNKISLKIGRKQKLNKPEYDDLDLSDSLDSKYEEKTVKRLRKRTKWSLIDRISCIRNNLDIFYIIICFVVFLLHWASENICINIAIALISITITLILNNWVSEEKPQKT